MCTGGVVTAQDKAEQAVFAYPTKEGVAWVDALNDGIILKTANETSRIVWPGSTGDLFAVSGNRLVMGWTNQLMTFPAGSWTPQVTSADNWITALAASPETALAFDALSGIWRLEKNGSWSRHESGIKDHVTALAWHRALWVAAGATRGIEAEDGEDEEDLSHGGKATPSWVTAKTSPRIWWSTDGVKWQAGALPQSRYNQIGGVIGSTQGWLAAGLNGTLYGSNDGKTWQQVGAVPHTSQSESLRLVAMGGDYLIRFGDEPWFLSADGRDWTQVPLAEGARLDAPFMKDGKIHALGMRKPGRRLEIAELAGFAIAPEPNAAELAVLAVAEEKVRVAAQEKAATTKKITAAKALAETKPLGTWAQKLASWDVAIGKAKDNAERRALCKALNADWQAAHPGFTQNQVVAYLTPIFIRVTGYETSDLALYGFIFDSMNFHPAPDAFINSLPTEVRDAFKKIAGDQLAIMQAKQKKLTPPVFPPRLKTKTNPPTPQRRDAPFDLEAMRLLAARGDAAAAYDMASVYLSGQGVPTDPVASRFWMRQAELAGLKFLEATTNDKEWQAKSWQMLAAQGSRMAQKYYADVLLAGSGPPADPAEAIDQYKRAAAAGQYEAMMDIYRIYSEGKHTGLDHALSRQHLEEAAGFGFPPAIAQLGFIYEAGIGIPRDLVKAAASYRSASELGYGWAMKRYADFLLAGRGVPADEAAGKQWMGQAAAKGDVHAQAALTELTAGKYQPAALSVYVAPKKRRPTFDPAKRRQQAESGDAAACFDLAYAYWHGLGVRTDNTEGNHWLARAKAAGWKTEEKWALGAEALASWTLYADQGSIVAMDKVMTLSTHVSDEERLVLIRRAAEAGMAQSQRILGIIYRDGVSVPTDKGAGYMWFKRAAEIGDPDSQRELGFCYDTGRGVTRDDAQAAHWYSLAAEDGDRTAIANLANMLTSGRGVPRDLSAASSWYLKLAGLPGETVPPLEAASRIRAMAEAGDSAAFGVWGIMLRSGFGVKADNDASFAYGFVAIQMNQGIYSLSWFETPNLRRSSALRQAAKIAAQAIVFSEQSVSKDPKIAANPATEKRITLDDVFTMARPENSVIVPILRAIENDTLTVEQVKAQENRHEPFALRGLGFLMIDAYARPELADQPWLLRLAGVAEKTPHSDGVEKLFQKALLTPPGIATDTARLQTLRRLAAARLYYGIGRPADRPAALAWALISVTNTDSLLAIELLSRELSPEQIDSADELYQRINARLSPATK